MPLDPSIPLSVQPFRLNNPFDVLSKMREEQQRDAERRDALRQRDVALRQSQQRLDREAEQDAESTKQRFTKQQIHDAAEGAYQKIKDGNTEEVLGLLQPEARVMAEGWLSEVAKAKQDRDAQGIALGKQTAKFIQANNYDPVTSATALKVLSDVHPGAKDALEHVTDPAGFKKLIDHFATLGEKPAPLVEHDPQKEQRGPSGELITAAQTAPVKEPTSFDAAILAARNNPTELNRLLKLKRQEADAGRAPESGGTDRAPFWVNRNGKMIRIKESDYQPGDLPASTREQGRPVPASVAEDLADFDTSLDELKAVRAAIAPSDSTGIVAQIGAKIPYVTQITGWGTDAKKRQAVIDRVKQVIGKTLEGGVLRKEDEAKYEKILPTIGDAQSVAIEKLNGLDVAIAKRKQRRLDNLADANYDVSKQTDRGAKPGATIRARDPQGKLHEAAAGTALPAGWVLEP